MSTLGWCLAVSCLLLGACGTAPYRNLQYSARRARLGGELQKLHAAHCVDVAQAKATRANAYGAVSAVLGTVLLGSGAVAVTAVAENAKSSTLEEHASASIAVTAFVGATLFSIARWQLQDDADDAADASLQILAAGKDFKPSDYADCEPLEPSEAALREQESEQRKKLEGELARANKQVSDLNLKLKAAAAAASPAAVPAPAEAPTPAQAHGAAKAAP